MVARKTNIFLIGTLTTFMFLQLLMVFWFEMNWDEFLLLDWVYDWIDGKTYLPFQTIYLRAFTWLPRIAEYETEQIIAARCVMFVCFSLICWFVYKVSTRFSSQPAALLATIFLISFSFVFRHATSFRMDTLVTTVLMMVVWCVTHPNITKRHVITAGLGLGLAGMITIKAAFYVPTITVILLIRWWANQWHRKHLLEGFSIGLLALGSFTTLYFLHSTSLNAPISGTNYIESVASGSLGSFGLLPQRFTLVMSLLQNPFHWVLLACGLCVWGQPPSNRIET